MNVKIGKYPNRWMCRIHTDYMDKKYGYYDWKDNRTRFEGLLEKLENAIQWVYNHTVNLYYDNAEQSVKVRIDPWDTWSMDYTLAYIIVPMLKQLKETKHGACLVDNEDVPSELQMPNGWYDSKYRVNGETDPNFFARWDYVLDEMIWAFESKCRDDWDVQFFTQDDFDQKGYEAYQQRLSNGFRLFGKYYESLWD